MVLCSLQWPVAFRSMENDDVKQCGLVSDGYMSRCADWKQPGCNILPYPRLEILAASVQNNDKKCESQRVILFQLWAMCRWWGGAHTSLGNVLSALIESGDIKHWDSYRSPPAPPFIHPAGGSWPHLHSPIKPIIPFSQARLISANWACRIVIVPPQPNHSSNQDTTR